MFMKIMTLLPLPWIIIGPLFGCISQTSQLFSVYSSSSCIIILVLVLECSEPQDDEVSLIFSMKQRSIQFDVSPHRVFHATVTYSNQNHLDQTDPLHASLRGSNRDYVHRNWIQLR